MEIIPIPLKVRVKASRPLRVQTLWSVLLADQCVKPTGKGRWRSSWIQYYDPVRMQYPAKVRK